MKVKEKISKAKEKTAGAAKATVKFIEDHWLAIIIGTGAVVGTALKIEDAKTRNYVRRKKCDAECEALLQHRSEEPEQEIIYKDDDITITKF